MFEAVKQSVLAIHLSIKKSLYVYRLNNCFTCNGVATTRPIGKLHGCQISKMALSDASILTATDVVFILTIVFVERYPAHTYYRKYKGIYML